MIRRVIVFAVLVCVLALLGVAFWELHVPKPAMPRLAGELRSASLVVNGRQRTFSFYISSLRPNPPLLLVLHVSMMTGKKMRMDTGYAFDEIADREGFLVVYPDGYGGYWNDCRHVGDYEAKRLAINDVAFLRALVDWFRREYHVATNDVFATLPTKENQGCAASGRPVATIIVNGTDDPLNPYGGGRVALFGIFLRRGHVQSTLATATYWANLAGHRGPPVVQDLPDNDPSDGATATRYRWSGDNGPSVVLLAVHGGGHTIPHPTVRGPRLLGRTCHDFSAAREIWEFFAR